MVVKYQQILRSSHGGRLMLRNNPITRRLSFCSALVAKYSNCCATLRRDTRQCLDLLSRILYRHNNEIYPREFDRVNSETSVVTVRRNILQLNTISPTKLSRTLENIAQIESLDRGFSSSHKDLSDDRIDIW